MKKLIVMLIGAAVVLALRDSSARAFPQFKKAFAEKYVDVPGANPNLAAAFKAAGCNTCHVKGQKDRSFRNAYGKALAKHIPGDAKKRLEAAAAIGGVGGKTAEMAKLLKELDTAFSKVEDEKSPAGPTFGARIKAGQLPSP